MPPSMPPCLVRNAIRRFRVSLTAVLCHALSARSSHSPSGRRARMSCRGITYARDSLEPRALLGYSATPTHSPRSQRAPKGSHTHSLPPWSVWAVTECRRYTPHVSPCAPRLPHMLLVCSQRRVLSLSSGTQHTSSRNRCSKGLCGPRWLVAVILLVLINLARRLARSFSSMEMT